MVQEHGMEFATSIGVLFSLKELHGFKTLQETYKLFENADLDVVVEVLTVSYNKANKTTLSSDDFLDLMGEKGVGFILLSEIFQKIVEAIMYDGLTPQQVESKKKMLNL